MTNCKDELSYSKQTDLRSDEIFRLPYLPTLPSTLVVNALALLALCINGSPVKPAYTNAYLLSAVVVLSSQLIAIRTPLIRKNARTGM